MYFGTFHSLLTKKFIYPVCKDTFVQAVVKIFAMKKSSILDVTCLIGFLGLQNIGKDTQIMVIGVQENELEPNSV